VLDAVVEEIATNGDTASVQSVALRAGVHETSIYRRWKSRESLFLEALIDRTRADIPVADTGSLRGDLIATARAVTGFIQSATGQSLLRVAIQAPAGHDEQLHAFWQARREALTVIIDRARDRGELKTNYDARLILETLIAPLHFRTLLTREPIDPKLPQQIADLILGGVQDD
jgi:AcrR family transcriptional regulator